MGVQAFRFLPGPSAGVPVACDVPLDAEGAPSRARCEQPLAAFVVKMEDLERWVGCAGTVDRGTKTEKRSLSSYLLSRGEIPLIRGSYSHAGQLMRSLRDFLDNAADHKEENLYLIGIDSLLFETLIGIAASAKPNPFAPDEVFASLPISRETCVPASDLSAQTLLDRLGTEDVPPELERAYVGGGVHVRLVHQLILRAARMAEPVLILGETGTGKEIVAQWIHRCGDRREHMFLPVNCGAIPRDLLESELFGHRKGSFTGASSDKKGQWAAAGGGTLFLDEIGELAVEHQAKILRALQSGEVQPVGADKPVRVKARVVAATNRDLFAMVQAGQFREDLYYRLRAFQIRTPALREHPADIPALAGHFWRGIAGPHPALLSGDFMAALQERPWPGNARDLRATLACLFALFGNKELTPDHLDTAIRVQSNAVGAVESLPPRMEARVHRAQCVRHLRRADDAIRAAQAALRPISRNDPLDAATRESLRAALRGPLAEIESLCAHPLLFSHPAANDAVCRLRGKLTYLYDLIDQQTDGVAAFWRKDLSREFKTVLAPVAAAYERLQKEQ